MSLRSSLSARAVTIVFAAGTFFGAATTALTADVLGSTIFSDVPSGAYYDAATGRLQVAGIMKGTDGRFNPAQFVTRAELATVIDRLMNGGDFSVPERASSSSRSRSSSSSSSSSSSVEARTDAGSIHFTTSAFSTSNKISNLTVSVIRSGGAKGAVSVKYDFSGGTAVAEKDYNPATGVIDFKDGETSKLLSLRVVNSGVAGPSVTVNLTLSEPTGGAVLSSPSSAVITILNNNSTSSSSAGTYSSASSAPGGTISFSALGYTVDEQSGGITVTVKRAGNTASAVTVEYATADGTAKAGTQYSSTQGTLSFAAGESSKTFSVQVSNNATIDGNKSLTVSLKNPTANSNLGYPSTATIIIADDEAATISGSGSLQFPSESFVVGESDGTATILVTRTGGSAGTVGVNYATADGSAIAGSDYVASSGTLSFAPGETSKFFLVTITKDSNPEDEERVNLTLSSVTGGASLGMQATATLKIRN